MRKNEGKKKGIDCKIQKKIQNFCNTQLIDIIIFWYII